MKRILVVDDEISIANLISSNLEQAGYNGTSFFDIVPQRRAKGKPARRLRRAIGTGKEHANARSNGLSGGNAQPALHMKGGDEQLQ